MPASTSNCGPWLGYRPLMLVDTFTTAPTWRSISASALSRSRSRWSMIAISPDESRLTRFLVRRSSRAVPVIPGRSSVLVRCARGSLKN